MIIQRSPPAQLQAYSIVELVIVLFAMFSMLSTKSSFSAKQQYSLKVKYKTCDIASQSNKRYSNVNEYFGFNYLKMFSIMGYSVEHNGLNLWALLKSIIDKKKKHNLASPSGDSFDQQDSDLFQRRTIPPIPGITNGGHGQPELTSYMTTESGFEEEKEKEAEAEAELEKEQMVRRGHVHV